jgi:hypothetical protein
MVALRPAVRGGWRTRIVPGVVLTAGLGLVLGGAAGTADWPVVGTSFGAVGGAVGGGVVGVVLVAVLGLLARFTRSAWTVRAVSGAIAAAACLGVAGSDAGTTAAIVLVSLGSLAGAALGPAIAFGVEPGPDGRPGFTWALATGARLLARGGALGAVIGAVAGFTIGLDYLPTAVFAAFEGAILGGVSGLVLAGLVVGAAVLPRLHPLS